jgi:hypothetical protein
VPRSGSSTLLHQLRQHSALAEGPGPGRLLIWSGLRVRMGLHSGVKAADVLVRKEDLRTVYQGGQS